MDKKRELEQGTLGEHEEKKARLENDSEAYYNGLETRLSKRLSALSERDRELVTRMLELSCCGRCVLRMLGVKDYAFYELTDVKIRPKLMAVMTPNAVVRSTDDYVCTLCVGSVQYAEDYSETVVERLKKDEYTTKTFNMNVTVPTSTLVRQHAFRVHLHDTMGEDTSQLVARMVDIKEIFKLVLSWQVSHLSGLTLDFASPLKALVTLRHNETADDHLFLSSMPESGMKLRLKREKKKQIRIGDGRPAIVSALSRVTDARFKEKGTVPPSLVQSKPEIEKIEIQHESVYVGGRYLKFSRDVSQTPWTIGKTKLAELSVSDIVAEPVKKAFRADDFKFVTAGREDANVRMLGSGRPFYIELVNPRTVTLSEDEYASLQEQINQTIPDKVQVRKLGWIPSEATKIIKEGEETKTKSYSALCWMSQPVTKALLDRINSFGQQQQRQQQEPQHEQPKQEQQEQQQEQQQQQLQQGSFVVDQQTPIRVLQRRAQMIRKKTIFSLRAFALGPDGQAVLTEDKSGEEKKDGESAQADGPITAGGANDRQEEPSHFLVVHLHTEAGTYIKEFVHGDLGRNQPNLGAIAGCEADIMELDVLDVDLEFPPPRES